jgi:hypothetical protein
MNNEQNEKEEEDKMEKERRSDENNFKNKYRKFIDKIDNAFYKQVTEEEIVKIIKALISMPSLTIFEAMNLIYRHVKIYKALNFYRTNDDKRSYLDVDIYENKYPDEYPCNKQSNRIIEYFKVKKKDEDNIDAEDDEFYYKSEKDRRRRITKNRDDIYNYLPIFEDDKIFFNELDKKYFDKLQIFAKNENEVYFHPLFYKTRMCYTCVPKKDDCLIKRLCPYSHDIQDDFKIIYDYKDKAICELMNSLNNSKLFSFESYLKYIPKKINFDTIDLKSFKVHKCLLDSSCPTDYHLCPFYHESKKETDAPRRPPFLFRYCSEICEDCYDKHKRKYIVKNCPYGDFCNYIHNKNEYNYHFERFRLTFKCTRNPKGKCPFIKTCYGIHNGIENDENPEEEEEESESGEKKVDEQKIEEKLDEEDEEIKEIKDKIKNLVHISKNFRCRKCNNLKNIICYLIECKHFICNNCFKRMAHETKDYKKEKKFLKCPYCNKELAKGKLIEYQFLKN